MVIVGEVYLLPPLFTVTMIFPPDNVAEARAPEPVVSTILTVKGAVRVLSAATVEIAVITPFVIVVAALAPEPPPPVNVTAGAVR